MTYDQARDQEQLGKLEAAIGLFINRFNSSPPSQNRQTIILFPGGLGSQLVRADSSYQNGVPGQVFSYDTVWLDCNVLTGAPLDLQMQNDIDSENKFIVADGAIDFLWMDIRPYNRFLQWCSDQNLDWFVYGWDWRRRLDHTVDFFLTKFLPRFQQRVHDACGVDPLQNFTLIGHSFGGMVVKLIMNDPNPIVDKMKRAVTVGTPFYGYAGQVHRYFEGEYELNFEGTARITRVVSSLPGGYVLLFLDKDTYDRDKGALAADPDYPLTAYPSVDATNSSIIADPYNPKTNGNKVRYPKNYGFTNSKLSLAKGVYQQVASPLSDVRNQKFYNVRGVQIEDGEVANGTVNSVKWDWISKNFNPDTDATPIKDTMSCPGDGVIPAWSARLVSASPANVRTLVGELDHMTMMNAEKIQNELAGILGLPQMMIMRRATSRPARGPSKKKVATRKDISKFVRGLTALRTRHEFDSKSDQEQATRRYLAKYNLVELRGLIGRAFIDALKTPSQKVGQPPQKTPVARSRGRHRKKRQ